MRAQRPPRAATASARPALLDQGGARRRRVRASRPVDALRLDGTRLRRPHALAPRGPDELRGARATRSLSELPPLHSSFAKLPNEALGSARRRASSGSTSRRAESSFARATRRGRCTSSRRAACAPTGRSDGRQQDLAVPPQGRLLRRALALPRRAARGEVEAVDGLPRCCGSRPTLFRRCSRRAPGVPRAARGARPAVRLPAPRARAARLRRGDPARRRLGRTTRSRRRDRSTPRRPPRRRPSSTTADARGAAAERSGASRTSSSSTRWTAAPRAWRWSAATSAAHVSHRAHPRGRAHLDRRHDASPGSRAAPQELGLDARSVRASKSRLDELPLPAIVHWEGNHWVVLYRVDDDHVRVADPARGLRRVTRAEFLENWSGYASVIAYDASGFEEAPEAQHEPRLAQAVLAAPPPARRGRVVLAAIAAGARARAADPHAGRRRPRRSRDDDLQFALDRARRDRRGRCSRSPQPRSIQRYLLSRVAVRFDVATLDFLTGRLLALPMSYFATRRTGDIERRLRGARQVREFLVQSGVTALTAATQLVAALVAHVRLQLGARPRLPREHPAVRRPDALLGDSACGRCTTTSRRPTAVLVAPDRRDPRHRDRKGARRRRDSLRKLMLARFQALADRVFRTQFLVLAYQGSLQLVSFASFGLFLLVGALEVVARAAYARPVRRVQRAARARERARACRSSRSGTSSSSAGSCSGASTTFSTQEPEQGAPRASPAGDDARRTRRAARTSASATAAAGSPADPRRTHAHRRARVRPSRSSVAAAPARRR